jgi:hypothetical protein
MIFDYLSAIYGIRNTKNTPFIASQYKIQKSLVNVHLDILKYSYDHSASTALIYENELSLIRDLEDVTNNEIKQFMMTNPDWDILIIGLNEIVNKTLQNGYTRIYKVNDSTTFYSQYAYIASRRFMQKAKTNNLASLNTYLYTPTFAKNLGNTSTSNIYTVGLATNILLADSINMKYTWTPVKIE